MRKSQRQRTKRLTGIGGVFFKARNPEKLCAWYRNHLGLPINDEWCGWSFEWRDAANPRRKGSTAWSAFDPDTKYFGASKQSHMINYCVDDLKSVLAKVKREGVWLDSKVEESEYGKFGWIKDGEGNRIERWQPPKGK